MSIEHTARGGGRPAGRNPRIYRLTHFGVSRGSTAKVHLSIRIRSRGSATVILLPCVARNTCWMASLRVFSSERSDLDFATICCACLRTLAACLRSSSGWLDDIVHLMSCQETGDVLIYPGLSGLRNFFDTVLFDSAGHLQRLRRESPSLQQM